MKASIFFLSCSGMDPVSEIHKTGFEGFSLYSLSYYFQFLSNNPVFIVGVFIGLLIIVFLIWRIILVKKESILEQTIFESYPDALLILDLPSLAIFKCNLKSLIILGYNSSEELNGKFANSVLSEKSIKIIHEAVNDDTQRDFHAELRTCEGKIFPGLLTCKKIVLRNNKYMMIKIQEPADEIAHEDHKNMLMQVINLVPHHIYLKDNEGKFVFVNHSFAEQFPFTAEEIPGKTVYELYNEKDARKILENEQEVIKRGRSKFVSEEFPADVDGNTSYFHSIKVPFFLEEKNQTGILNVSIDITESKVAEKTVRESELKYRMLMEQASDGIYLCDSNGFILEANRKACDIFGYEPDEFLNLNIQQLVDSSSYPAQNISVKSLISLHPVIQERICRKKDGSTIMVEISASILEDGRRQAIVRDITERKKLENILRDNEHKYRVLIENSSDLVAILSEDFRIKYISRTSKRILGYSPDSVNDKIIFELVHPADIDLVSKTLSDVWTNPGQNQLLEAIRLRNASGYYQYFEMIGVNMLEDKVANGIIINCHDVTKRVQTEKELITINHELDSFVYKASHDLKAPLRSLSGLIKLAMLENKEPVLNNYFDMMQNSIAGLDSFIKDLIQFSRNSRPDVECREINFEKIVSEAFNNLKFAENADEVSVHNKIEVEGEFYSDGTRVTSIISNLVSNAYKYHRYKDNNPYINISIKADNKEAEIIVEDNGQGIEAVYQERIFDMFFRASEQSDGSGLGLYIVRNVVAKLGGEITLESMVGKGSKFIVHIPNLINDLHIKNERK